MRPLQRCLPILIALCTTANSAVPADSLLLQASEAERWYRGNTHAHTLWSDGDAAPEAVVAWYRDRAYNFLALSDHNIIADGLTTRFQPIREDGLLTPERVADLRARFGPSWVVETTIGGRRYMRLKTLPELRGLFEQPGRFLLIPAEELSAWSPNVHVNGINLQETIPPTNEASVEASLIAMLDAIDEQGRRLGRPVLGHINHPNWGEGITAEQIVAVGGERFFEVYNGHPDVRNAGSARRGMPSTERLWDIVLALRLRDGGHPLYGLATDDAHAYFAQGASLANSGRGWIVVLAPELTPGAIIGAMRAGRFYASTGVALDSIGRDPAALRVHVREEPGVDYKVEFIGTTRDFDAMSSPVVDDSGQPVRGASRRYGDTIGVVLDSTSANPAVYRFSGDELYVRARIVSSKLQDNPVDAEAHQMAWTQPVLPAAPSRSR